MITMKKSFLLFTLATLTALCTDFFFFFLLEKPLIYALTSVFAIYALCPYMARTALLLLLICCESFVYYGTFGLPLIYLLPLSGIGLIVQRACYITPLYHFCLLLIALAGQLAVDHLVLKAALTPSYTLTIIFANIVILTLFTGFNKSNH